MVKSLLICLGEVGAVKRPEFRNEALEVTDTQEIICRYSEIPVGAEGDLFFLC